MKKIFLISIATIILSVIFIFFAFVSAQPLKFINIVKINNKEIKVKIAKTDQEQYQGLSEQTRICPDCGLLFVFEKKKERTFVMRKMMFPLDIIWINEKKIVKIDSNLPPEDSSSLTNYQSKEPVDYVLEVNAGFCANNNIKTGDEIWINFQ